MTNDVSTNLKGIHIPNIELMGPRVLVKRFKPSEKSSGGILLGNKEERMFKERGIVVAVGPGALRPEGGRTPVAVQPGHVVLLRDGFNIEQATIEGHKYVICNEDGIMAILHGEDCTDLQLEGETN